jgi:hypothetical protein
MVWFLVVALVVASFTHALAAESSKREPGTSVEMPYLIAPVVVDGALTANAYISNKVIATSPAATIVVRDKLAFIQDAYVRDVNSTPIGKPSDPATVDVPALTQRLLADAKRVAGAGQVDTVEIIRVQVSPLRGAGHS